MKAFMLGLCHWSPLCLLLLTLLVDCLLIYEQFKRLNYCLLYKKSWLASNILVNSALIIVVVAPNFQLSLVFITILLIIAIVLEGYIHYREK